MYFKQFSKKFDSVILGNKNAILWAIGNGIKLYDEDKKRINSKLCKNGLIQIASQFNGLEATKFSLQLENDYLRNQMGYDFAPRGSAADQAFHQVFGA